MFHLIKKLKFFNLKITFFLITLILFKNENENTPLLILGSDTTHRYYNRPTHISLNFQKTSF